MRTKGAALLFAALAMAHGTAQGQSDPQGVETAKPYDTVSPTGVSFASGSFTYNVELLSIGTGEFPQKLTLGLQYDSAADAGPNATWSSTLTLRRTSTILSEGPTPQWHEWARNVTMGQRKATFENVGPPHTNANTPTRKGGDTLDFIGTHTSGYYKYVGGGGEELLLPFSGTTVTKPVLTYPDGLKVEQTGCTSFAACFVNNLGLAILAENKVSISGGYTQKFCAVNLTDYQLSSLSSCPSGVQSAVITFVSDIGGVMYERITAIQFPDGQTETYQYGGSSNEMTCIKSPGETQCRVTNQYDTCGVTSSPYNGDDRNRVISQTFQTGESITYSWTSVTYQCNEITAATMTQAGAVTSLSLTDRQVTSVTDPNSLSSAQTWTGDVPTLLSIPTKPLLDTATLPEGNWVDHTYDPRGNRTETRLKAKSGTGLADIVTSAVYPTASTPYACTNRVTCNKPTSTTDARGKVTDYTYNATHGGVLTVTSPADANGVRPQTRYTYVQRYAWIKNGAGYAQAASPVWLLDSEEFCRTSAASGSSCAAGASDEVVTTYDYGPNSGPNNLWLRGKAVTADGTTLRTCYQRDSYGRVIAETSPNANLSSCS
jgi:hypothetical protein